MNPQLENEYLYRPAPTEKPDPSLRLSPLEWRLMTAVDGFTSLAEIARSWDLNPDALAAVADKLKIAGLLVCADYTFAEYQAALQSNQATPPVAEPAARKYSASLKRRGPTGVVAAAPAASALPASEPVSSVMGSPERGPGFQLRPLINFIIQQAGGGTMGQLAVYRVFCQVPNELLLKSRITSLNLVGDSFVIQDVVLKTRLLEATRTVLGVDFR